jgi:glycosyltransferase involved in cell wall biosynthesis
MYDITLQDRAPKIRIGLMTEALSRQTHTERVTGGRVARFLRALRWLASGGPRRVGAVYVESATTSSMPTDLLFLATMRLLRRPVGVFFRDVYQLYRDIHPRERRRQVLSDWLWRMTTPLLMRVASVRFAPTPGMAAVLGIPDAVMLPPGTDPTLPDLGIGDPDVVATVAQAKPGSGLDTLIAAMKLVRERRPNARLQVVARSLDREMEASLPDWVRVTPGNREALPGLLRPGRVLVLPLPIDAYTRLEAAVRLPDLMGYGKPIVTTDTPVQRALIEASQAGIVTPDSADGLAQGILAILEDESLARRLAANARRYACSAGATWDARARTVMDTLGLVAAPAEADPVRG